ncbi:YdeI/OmpD-associated family protein [Streptomyces canus]|uniref:YdeI/OmpD-associated family protein n=1 Tax=Streptomyces canus TaxID=58343 RepID=UPI0036B2713B
MAWPPPGSPPARHGCRRTPLARPPGHGPGPRWEAAYDDAKAATLPDDLTAALTADPAAAEFFETLARQNRYAIRYRIQDSTKAETQARRIGRAPVADLVRAVTPSGVQRAVLDGEHLLSEPAMSVLPMPPRGLRWDGGACFCRSGLGEVSAGDIAVDCPRRVEERPLRRCRCHDVRSRPSPAGSTGEGAALAGLPTQHVHRCGVIQSTTARGEDTQPDRGPPRPDAS